MADIAPGATTNPRLVLPALGAAPSNPVAPTVKASVAAATTIRQMQFPQDLPKYYFEMAAVDWSQRNDASVLLNTQAQIALPLPEQLIDGHTVRWNQANMLNEVFSAGSKVLAGLAGSLLPKSLAQSQRAAIGATFGGIGAAGAAEGAGLFLRAGMGIAPNQFITILFESPEYKQHQFTWNLACNTPREAEQIRQIIQFMNNNMAPGAGGNFNFQDVPLVGNISGNLWWNFPSVWLMSFVPNSDYIFKFKPAVLTNFVVDYSGGHSPSFHRADPATSAGSAPQNAPVNVTIHAQFVEIEYWKKGDYVTNADLEIEQQQ